MGGISRATRDWCTRECVMASKTRDDRIVAAVACPRCGAAVGEPCRNPVPHQNWRGPEDRRAQPSRPHNERRAEWVRWRRLSGC